ncbi:MAG: hypothetical protein SFX18_13275 [Pirellulales bacterium]|nr:hypothetical protein [Pirellulales bacterium]
MTDLPAILDINTPARLHFGLLGFGQGNSPLGRQYGGVGVMLAQPGWRLRMTTAAEWRVTGPQRSRVEGVLEKIIERWQLLPTEGVQTPGVSGEQHPSKNLPVDHADRASRQVRPFAVEVLQALPPHAGLGSGTQLALALALALFHWHGRPIGHLSELVRLAGRGERSAVGSHGFLHGGLIVEPGRLTGETLPPLVRQVPLPPDWHVLLIRPLDLTGTAGDAERAAFARLPPISPTITHALAGLLLLEILPAALSADFVRFGQAVYRYGLLAGECFSPIQGGPYAHERIGQMVQALRGRGVAGVGQSSWGPVIYAWFKSLCAAEEWAEALSQDPLCAGCELTVTPPARHGVTVNGAPWCFV